MCKRCMRAVNVRRATCSGVATCDVQRRSGVLCEDRRTSTSLGDLNAHDKCRGLTKSEKRNQNFEQIPRAAAVVSSGEEGGLE